jgi:hypothetical protein
MLVVPAVVFGRVVEGMAVVARMESMGSSSGRPKLRVTIADCGQVRQADSRPLCNLFAPNMLGDRAGDGAPRSIGISSFVHWGVFLGWGLLHVDTFTHNKGGIAYRDRSRRPEAVVFYKCGPHQQPSFALDRRLWHHCLYICTSNERHVEVAQSCPCGS